MAAMASLATIMMDCDGRHAKGSHELLAYELRKPGVKPDSRQRVALEVIAASGQSGPGTVNLIVEQLRNRRPTESDIDEFIIRIRRRVSLKTGKVIAHERVARE